VLAIEVGFSGRGVLMTKNSMWGLLGDGA
jgi:hypothetical protein